MGIKIAAAPTVDRHTVTVEDLDRRITQIAVTLEGACDVVREPLAPRPISAAEIVRRVRPFLVWN